MSIQLEAFTRISQIIDTAFIQKLQAEGFVTVLLAVFGNEASPDQIAIYNEIPPHSFTNLLPSTVFTEPFDPVEQFVRDEVDGSHGLIVGQSVRLNPVVDIGSIGRRMAGRDITPERRAQFLSTGLFYDNEVVSPWKLIKLIKPLKQIREELRQTEANLKQQSRRARRITVALEALAIYEETWLS